VNQGELQQALRARAVSLQRSLDGSCSFSWKGSWEMKSGVLTHRRQGPGLFYTVSCACETRVIDRGPEIRNVMEQAPGVGEDLG